ncbi:hypothetical protein EVAR_7603_1 [Eumeta japonica]|uniref:Uncharacterized protein n=1 Tax=Eumeta variegata TaxID=151549 RepID=A0A4C1TL43_EUMVA|nr:hypothetical protein EVAR_7603_1 [Eumeta japonica]
MYRCGRRRTRQPTSFRKTFSVEEQTDAVAGRGARVGPVDCDRAAREHRCAFLRPPSAYGALRSDATTENLPVERVITRLYHRLRSVNFGNGDKRDNRWANKLNRGVLERIGGCCRALLARRGPRRRYLLSAAASPEIAFARHGLEEGREGTAQFLVAFTHRNPLIASKIIRSSRTPTRS